MARMDDEGNGVEMTGRAAIFSRGAAGRDVRTSLTDPLFVSFLETAVPGLPGRLGMTMCPGRRQRALSGTSWQRDLADDLDRLVTAERIDLLVSLVEDRELEELGADQLQLEAERRGLLVERFPIPDGGVPEMRPTKKLVARIVAAMREGKSVAVHCAAGLGRSGTVTACVLTALGVRADMAIRAVRFVRPGTIENERQEAFVKRFTRARRQSTARPKRAPVAKASNVISLGAVKAKKEAVKEAVNSAGGRLAEAHREIYGAAVTLACAGPWSAWSDAQPVGTKMTFDVAMLAGCRDARVVALVGVVQAIEGAMASMTRNP